MYKPSMDKNEIYQKIMERREKRFLKDIELINYFIRCCRPIDDSYKSAQDDSSESKKQTERTLNTKKISSTDVNAISYLLIATGISGLAKHYIGNEQSVFLFFNEPNSKEFNDTMKKTQEIVAKSLSNYCLVPRKT